MTTSEPTLPVAPVTRIMRFSSWCCHDVGVPANEFVLPAMVDDLRELVRCESPSTDPVALARSAEVVADQGRRFLGEDPELIVVGGRTHLRWQLGAGPSRVLLV